MYQIGWFSTARGPTSRALLRAAWDATQRGEVAGRIAFVFCSRAQGESPETDQFLAQVRGYGIPLVALSFARLRREHGGRGTGFDGQRFAPWREDYDQEALRLLQGYRPDLVVLAGFMLVQTPALCGRFTEINLHPAAPDGPAGTWQEVIWWLIREGAAHSGIRMHLVTPALDQGPVVTYCTYPLRGGDLDRLWAELAGQTVEELKARYGEELPLFRRIRQEGVARELPLLLATLKAYCAGSVRVQAGQVLDAAGRPIPGHDLTREIEGTLAGIGSQG
ncbi:MAG: phosphoglycerate transporter [Chloroflexi bacterium]|nr:phosphoglycerate transporter [Chloroflexota bacterium]